MLPSLISFMKNTYKRVDKWASHHHLNLIIYNLLITLMFLLRSAGYFNPYLPISVNLIMIFALVSPIFLFRANFKTIFVATTFFWMFTGFLGILKVNIWAERTAIYVFESLVLGVILLAWETIFSKE